MNRWGFHFTRVLEIVFGKIDVINLFDILSIDSDFSRYTVYPGHLAVRKYKSQIHKYEKNVVVRDVRRPFIVYFPATGITTEMVKHSIFVFLYKWKLQTLETFISFN